MYLFLDMGETLQYLLSYVPKQVIIQYMYTYPQHGGPFWEWKLEIQLPHTIHACMHTPDSNVAGGYLSNSILIWTWGEILSVVTGNPGMQCSAF